MDQKNNNTCMACSCPCEEHKEHNHPVDEKKEVGASESQQDGGVCTTCGTQKEKSKCGCN